MFAFLCSHQDGADDASSVETHCSSPVLCIRHDIIINVAIISLSAAKKLMLTSSIDTLLIDRKEE